MDERPISTRRKITLNGWEMEEEEEERKVPTTREQLKRAHLDFRNTLLMCLSSFPQFTQFNVQFQDLEDWYRFFRGKDIADRKPPPSETVLLYAERNAWREIHNRVYEGSTLKEAMAAQKADTLFWQREVYERLQKPQNRTQGPKGNTPSTKGKGKTKPAWSPEREVLEGHLKGKRHQLAQELGHSHPEGAAVLQRPSSFVTSASETAADHMDAL